MKPMDTEELLMIVGIAITLATLLLPGQQLSGTFCEGQSGRLGDYRVSVSDGYLMVSSQSGDVFVAWRGRIILRKVGLDYAYSGDEDCYTVRIRYKGAEYTYAFATGLSLAGGAFFYMAFLKYR